MLHRTMRIVGAMGLLFTAPRFVSAQETQDPLAKALQRDNVYVGKTRRHQVDAAALRALTDAAPSDRPLKIAVVTALPTSGRQFGTRNEYTKQLHDYLGLRRGTLIIVTGRGVSAATAAVPEDRITAILGKYARSIQGDPVPGLKQTVAALDAAAGQPARPVASGATGVPAPMLPPGDSAHSEHLASSYELPFLFLLVPIGLAGGLLIRAISGGIKRTAAMEAARLPVKRQFGETMTAISYADAYLDLLPDSPQATAAREARQRAAELCEQAAQYMRNARTPEDYGRAQAILEPAREAMEECRKQIDLATGGTGLAVAIEGTDCRATPTTGSAQAAPLIGDLYADRIPLAERGACFFCSRPSRISDLTPITIALNGQRRKVLACADDVRIIQEGAVPQIRTVTLSGRPMPWYSVPHYDPYRDYSSTDVSYMSGYGSLDAVTELAEGFLLDSLLLDSTPMPYPMFVMPDGQITNDWQTAQPDYADASANVGGIDFGGNGSDFGSTIGSDTNVGGVDFSSSSSDSGGSDFGGGSDSSGSSDSGGGSDY
jgi:uncharacterized membrane protein YgcG